MINNTTGQDHRALQAFTSLLQLVDGMAAITDSEQEKGSPDDDGWQPITLAAAGKSLTAITNKVLDCQYVGLFLLDPPDDRQRLLGVSGLCPEEERILFNDTNQVPLKNYVDAKACAQLHANQVVMLDLKQQPFTTSRSIHDARYRLVAPMVLHGELIGFFTIAKNDDELPDIDHAYRQEEIFLARGIARLGTQVIERVGLLQERADAHVNTQKLQEANRLYEDILTATSHELRTPLTTIKGNVQLSLRRTLKLEKQAMQTPLTVDCLQRIEQPLASAMIHFSKMEHMIREMLDDSRIQAGKFMMLMRTVNLVEIVRNAVAEVQRLMPERTILLFLPEEAQMPLFADAPRISEVVNNYLNNALKYGPTNHPIEVGLALHGSLACVSVRDYGPGIAYEEQARIWNRFYRVPGMQLSEDLGYVDANLGLGLYLCKEIIKLHHGESGLDSIPDQGSAFWFTLPLLQPD